MEYSTINGMSKALSPQDRKVSKKTLLATGSGSEDRPSLGSISRSRLTGN